jgi:PHP family Zn ribbon phosphoesterase
MKQHKTHTGTYCCPECCIEFDLMAEESLKCDHCGGPLRKGSLEDLWAEEDDLGNGDQ